MQLGRNSEAMWYDAIRCKLSYQKSRREKEEKKRLIVKYDACKQHGEFSSSVDGHSHTKEVGKKLEGASSSYMGTP